jgi:hypothetical protein
MHRPALHFSSCVDCPMQITAERKYVVLRFGKIEQRVQSHAIPSVSKLHVRYFMLARLYASRKRLKVKQRIQRLF